MAFKELKAALTASPVLIQPDPLKPYMIKIDALEWVIGYVLLQVGEDSKLHLVAFNRRKLNKAK